MRRDSTAHLALREGAAGATAAQQRAQRSAVTRSAWALCLLSVTLAVASVALATLNGESPVELVANHHAIGILDALILPLVGALIVVRDRRHLLAWLLLVGGVFLAVFNLTQQYAPLALGLTSRQLSLPGGDLASWLAAGPTCRASWWALSSWSCCSPTGACRRAAGGRSPGPAP